MGRWRPPAKASSPYITPDGAQALRQELDQLWRLERPQVVQALAAAAAEGDRSENAEYIYRKKQLAQMDRRIRFLNKRLEQVQVVQSTPSDQSMVRFGAWIQIADEDDQRQWLRIVGADETDAAKAWISVDSPMARALLGRREDDEVQVRTPSGDQVRWIVAVRYSAP